MEKLLTSRQAANLLNVWPHTLRRWERGKKAAKKLAELIQGEVAADEDNS